MHDLGIYGDDVAEILVGLAKLRAIDWSGFPFDDYFYDEPHLFSWGGLVQHAIGMKASSKSPLTIAMLVAALERGRWSPSVPAGSKAGQQE